MKAAVIFLVLLGLVAAVSAMILVKSLTGRRDLPITISDSNVDILLATRDLAMMEIVDTSAVETKSVPRSQAPEGALLNSVQVVGKVLSVGVVKGQPFTRACFARDGEGVNLAASLPRGKRAMSVSLSDWSGMAGLLYPGSVVDVLVSFEPRTDGGSPGMMSTTLLQGLQVLAIGSQSVASDSFRDKDPGALASRGQINHRMVTLLVDPKQAEILQLAMQNGNISLAMRNPLDAGRDLRRMTGSDELLAEGYVPPKKAEAAVAMSDPFAPRSTSADHAPAKKAELPPVKQTWETLINRAGVIEKREFEWPENPADPSAGTPQVTGQARQGI